MIAAVDCGTNTIKLLIGELPAVAVRASRMVRLGEGVDATGRLGEAALARAFAAIDEYAELVAAHPVDQIRFCATSATRDAANAEVFADGVFARLGVRPEVLSGDEEAALSFAGAVRHLRVETAQPVLVIDVGGGSTEVVLGVDEPIAGHSMDIGSVRMHERYLATDPPTAAEIAHCVTEIDRHLDASPVDLGAARAVVGVAGTVITVASGVLGLPVYDPVRTDQAILDVTAVHDFVAWLLTLTVAERRALPYMSPGRADVIGGGALILSRILRRTSIAQMIASEADILDGIAWSMVAVHE